MIYQKIFLTIIITFLVICCRSKPSNKKNTLPCDKIVTPEYDGKVVTFLDDKGNPVKDTIIERIPKYRVIFSPCKEYVFEATYKDSDNNLLSKELITLTPTGRRWPYQPEMQDEIIINYENSISDKVKMKSNEINPKFTISWGKNDTTGIIENKEKVWIHPFRKNQYLFTEIAPFPQVQLPLEIGKSWLENLNIGSGWGVWENSIYYWTYKVVGKEDKRMNFTNLTSCWKIEASSEGNSGKSSLIFWFHPEYGFIEMNYINHLGEKLSFKLKDVIFKN